MPISLQDLNENLKTLPEELYGEVNDFVDSLKTKKSPMVTEDWAEYLTPNQKNSIEKGAQDIQHGRVFSHTEAKEKIQEHLKLKS